MYVNAMIRSSFDVPSAPNVRAPASVIFKSNLLASSLMALENLLSAGRCILTPL
jgi:hypothetical protein